MMISQMFAWAGSAWHQLVHHPGDKQLCPDPDCRDNCSRAQLCSPLSLEHKCGMKTQPKGAKTCPKSHSQQQEFQTVPSLEVAENKDTAKPSGWSMCLENAEFRE